MTEVGVKEFRKNLKKYLKEMPISVTNRGDVIAVLVKPGFIDYLLEKIGEPVIADDTGSTTEVPTGELETI